MEFSWEWPGLQMFFDRPWFFSPPTGPAWWYWWSPTDAEARLFYIPLVDRRGRLQPSGRTWAEACLRETEEQTRAQTRLTTGELPEQVMYVFWVRASVGAVFSQGQVPAIHECSCWETPMGNHPGNVFLFVCGTLVYYIFSDWFAGPGLAHPSGA